MQCRRLSTLDFARKIVCPQIDSGEQLLRALDLPIVPDILATMDRERAAKFFILAPPQTIKSAAGQLRMARSMWLDPQPMLWYTPSDDFSKDFADMKWNPLFDALPQMRRLQLDAKDKRGKLRMMLTGGASLLILSANTENDRHGKTACDIYLDEVHKWENGWIGQIRNRREAFPGMFREVFMSTGLSAGTDAADEWDSTDQKKWYCRCPKCHELFEPRYLHRDPKTSEIIGGLRYDKKFLDSGLPDEGSIAASLVHECPLCHDTTKDTDATRLLFSGTAAAPRGQYVAANPRAAPKNYGWTFHGITVRPWLPIVMRFERAQLARIRGDIEPLANCIREDFAGIWNPGEHLREHKQRPQGEYAMGDPWAREAKDECGRPWRFGAVDVQLDHFVLCARSWAADSQSRQLYAEKVTTAGILADRLERFGILPERTFLDARHTPDTVRRLCGLHGWRPLMGEPEKSYPHKEMGNIRRIFSEPLVFDPWQGTIQQGRTLVAEFKFSKPSALERLHLLRTIERNDGEMQFSGAKDAPEWYWHEIDAYHRMPRTTRAQLNSPGTVPSSYEWVAHGPDHGADCECMGVVAASMAGLVGAESLDMPAEVKPAA